MQDEPQTALTVFISRRGTDTPDAVNERETLSRSRENKRAGGIAPPAPVIATAGDVKAAPAQKAQTADRTVLGTAEELKNYKELLDSGVISQEEFDAKKKQLLGL